MGFGIIASLVFTLFIVFRLDKKRRSDISELKEKLEYSERKHSLEMDALKDKIKNLKKGSISVEKENLQGEKTVLEKEIIEEPPIEKTVQEEQVSEYQNLAIEETAYLENVRKIQAKQENLETSEESDKKEFEHEEKASSAFIDVFFQQLFSPFFVFYKYLFDIYLHYKKANKLPVFFLTLGGIVTLIIGFGFLLSYSFENYFGPFAKVGVGFLASAGFIAAGIFLINKKKSFAEYASSLVGLGIILSYITIYFLSTFFKLAPPLIGFILIAGNTFLAAFLALRFETRIIAVLSLVGGAFSPFYLEGGSASLFYLSFLFVLVISAIYVSSKIAWEVLKHLALLLSMIIFEFIIFYDSSMKEILYAAIFIHLFHYLVIYNSLFEKRAYKDLLSKIDFGFIAASSLLFIFNFFDLIESNEIRGVILSVNAAVMLGLGFKINAVKHIVKMIYYTLFGTFLFFAILSLVPNDYTGLFWITEGLLLIIFGYKANYKILRKEGIFLIIIGLLKVMELIPDILRHYPTKLFSGGFINISLATIFLIVLSIIFYIYREKSDDFEKRVAYINDEIVPLLVLSVFYIPLIYYFDNLVLIISIIPMIGLIIYGSKRKLNFTHWVGISLFLMIIAQIVVSIFEVNSFHFGDQTVYGKIAIGETAFLLWALLFIYEKFKVEARTVGLMKFFREIFYLLVPLVIISPIKRRFPEFLPVTFWVSMMIAYTLNKFVNRKAVKIEVHILFLISALSSISAFLITVLINDDRVPFIIAPIVGFAILIILYILEKGWIREKLKKCSYKFILESVPYYIIVLIFSLSFLITASVTLSLFISVFTSILILFYKSEIEILRSSYRFLHSSAFGLFFLTIFYASSDKTTNIQGSVISVVTAVISLIFLGKIVYTHRSLYFKNLNGMKDRWKADVFMHHLLILFTMMAIGYLITKNVFGAWVTIVLAIYAIVLVFQTMVKRFSFLTKFSIILFGITVLKLFFYDLKDFSMIEKIGVFIITGLLFLASAFGIQKVKEKYNL